MNIFELHQKFMECKQELSTDTRFLTPGCLFFAWKGESQDGNVFAKEALEKGARYVVIDNPEYALDSRYLVVDDSIKTLEELARYHRGQFNIPVIAIGGSNGKTTTKELITHIFSEQKDVVASIGSLNNHVGVPKTLLRITKHTDIAVIEIGANHLGEIAHLCTIANPTHGLITNIGRDHIGLFGNQEAIINANVELYDYLRNHAGEAIVNKNNLTLMKFSDGLRRTCYTEGVHSEFGVHSCKTSPYVSVEWKGNLIKTKLSGEYNVENILAAIAVGVYFNIRDKSIISGLENYTPSNNRSEVLETENNNLIIKDFYNANLTSMKFALENLKNTSQGIPRKRSIAIMGDMLELGEYSTGEHQSAYDYAVELGIDEIVLVGKDFKKTTHQCDSYVDTDAAIESLKSRSFNDSVVLLKASNGTNFQKLFSEINW